ncbi:MAG: electron transfer flavoprotein subunit beta/FixA family protein, partial [Methanobacteriota archaeon]
MVRVVVCVKRVPKKMEVHIQANARPVLEGLEMQLDPNAKAAVLHGAELVQKHTGRLVALSFTRNEHALRESLALGADDAVLVRRPEQYSLDSTSVAAILAAAVHRIGGVDLVLLGARSADNMAGEVGPQLAHRLNVPYVG